MNDEELLRALCDPEFVTMTDAEITAELRERYSSDSACSDSSTERTAVGGAVGVKRPLSPTPAVVSRGESKILSYRRETTGDKNQTGRAEPMYPRFSGALRGSTASILRKNRSIFTASS